MKKSNLLWGKTSWLVIVTFTIACTCFADSEKILFEEKMMDGKKLMITRKIAPDPVTNEVHKKEHEEIPDKVFEYSFWFKAADSGAQYEKIWSEILYEYDISHDMPQDFRCFDAVFDHGWIIFLYRNHGTDFADAISIKDKTYKRQWAKKVESMHQVPGLILPHLVQSAKIEGKIEENSVIITLEYTDKVILRWHWDGKDWVEEKTDASKEKPEK